MMDDRRRRERDFGGYDDRGERDFKRRRHDDEDIPLPKKKIGSGGGGSEKEDEEPMSFREFLLKQRHDISVEEANAKYEEYVSEVRKRQPHVFFDEHKDEEWFRERYHPAALRARAKSIREEAMARAKEFADELEKSGTAAFKDLVTDIDEKRDEDGKVDAERDSKAGGHEEEKGDADQDEEASKNTDNVDTIFLRNIPPKLTRAKLEEALRNDGNFNLVHLRLGDVQPQRNLFRIGWARFDSPQTAKTACEELRGKAIKETVEKTEGEEEKEPAVLYRFEPVMNRDSRDRRTTKINILPKIAASAARLKHDVNQVQQVMRHLDKYRETESLNPLTKEFLETISEETKRLDLCVHYLFRVHLYSYYTGVEGLYDPSLLSVIPTRPKIDPNVEIALSGSGEKGNWERKVDDRVEEITGRKSDHPKTGANDGAALRTKKLNEWLDANTKVEGEGRFRCALPDFKLFRGVEFVHKHLRTRHVDAMEKVLQEADEEQFLENYVNDPNKIDASQIESPSAGRDRGSNRAFHSGPMRGPMHVGGPGPGYHQSWGRGMGPPGRGRPGRGPMPGGPVGGAMDPRAARVQAYNDLDAPAEGPKIQLVKYNDR